MHSWLRLERSKGGSRKEGKEGGTGEEGEQENSERDGKRETDCFKWPGENIQRLQKWQQASVTNVALIIKIINNGVKGITDILEAVGSSVRGDWKSSLRELTTQGQIESPGCPGQVSNILSAFTKRETPRPWGKREDGACLSGISHSLPQQVCPVSRLAALSLKPVF